MLDGKSETLTARLAAKAAIMDDFASGLAGINMNNFCRIHCFGRLGAIIFMLHGVDKAIRWASLKRLS
jgi:hypothetical protein